jgi:hypothetical protein
LDNHNLEAVDSGKVENLVAALEQFGAAMTFYQVFFPA